MVGSFGSISKGPRHHLFLFRVMGVHITVLARGFQLGALSVWLLSTVFKPWIAAPSVCSRLFFLTMCRLLLALERFFRNAFCLQACRWR